MAVIRKDSVNVFLINEFSSGEEILFGFASQNSSKYCLLVKDKNKGLEVSQKET